MRIDVTNHSSSALKFSIKQFFDGGPDGWTIKPLTLICTHIHVAGNLKVVNSSNILALRYVYAALLTLFHRFMYTFRQYECFFKDIFSFCRVLSFVAIL